MLSDALSDALRALVVDAVEQTIARLLPHLTSAGDELISVEQEAARLSITTKTMKRDLKRRGVAITKRGSKWFVRRADLMSSAATETLTIAVNDSQPVESEDERALRAARARVARPRGVVKVGRS